MTRGGPDQGDTQQLSVTGQYVPITVGTYASVAVQVAGTWTGTLVFEATIDKSTWFAINVFDSTGASNILSTTANGQWVMLCAGYTQVCVRASAVMTGTAVITFSRNQNFPIVRTSVVGKDAAGASLTGNPVVIGASDGSLVRVPRVHDLDSGAGTEHNQGVNLRQTASGGSIEVGLPYGSGAPLYTSDQMLEIQWRKAVLAALNHQLAFDATGARIRVYCNTGTLDTVTTVSTVSTVTTMSQLGGIAVRDFQFVPQQRLLVTQRVRSRIT